MVQVLKETCDGIFVADAQQNKNRKHLAKASTTDSRQARRPENTCHTIQKKQQPIVW